MCAVMIAALSVWWCRSGAAQGVPVIDNAAVSQAVADVNAATRQVQQLTAMLNQMRSIAQTLGQGGTPTWLVSQVVSSSGAGTSPFGSIMASAQSTYATVQAVATAGQQMSNSVQSILTQVDQSRGQSFPADFSSFSTARTWVQGELTPPSNANLSAFDLTRTAKVTLASQAAVDAYALALSARQQAPQTATRTQTLAQQASTASDLRGDVEANTAVMLAIHDELTQIQALMASLLKVEGASRLAATDFPGQTTTGISNGLTSTIP
jgi:hypothetical protein